MCQWPGRLACLVAVKYTAEFRRMCRLYEAHSSAPDLQNNIEVALGQFKDKAFMYDINAADTTSDKFVNYIAKYIITLNCYLGAKAYYFKELVEDDKEVTRMTEHVRRAVTDGDNRSHVEPFKTLSIEIHGDVYEYLKVQSTPKTIAQLEMACLF